MRKTRSLATLASRHAHVVAAVICLAILFATGVTSLKDEPLRHNEWNSQKHLYKFVADPPLTIGQTLDSVAERSEDHGPLYFVILNVWDRLVGRDLFTFRLLSLYFGALTIVFTFRLALITGNRDVAMSAVILISFLAFTRYYTQVVRMYSLLPMLTALVMWAYWMVVSAAAPIPRWRWVALILAGASLAAAHNFGFIGLAALGLYHLLFVKKNRTWLHVCLAAMVAALLYSPWLPVLRKAIAIRDVPVSDSLPLLESVSALLGIYSNGLIVIIPIAIAAGALSLGRLQKPGRYILFVALAITLLMLAANEITPVLIARRIRYTIILAAPLCCAIAIALDRLPWKKVARAALLALWIAGCFVYADSDDMELYTNELNLGTRANPSYQHFLYEPDRFPVDQTLIVSFHPNAVLNERRILSYYRQVLADWTTVIHITYDDLGQLRVQGGVSSFSTLDGIEGKYNAIWALFDPSQTKLPEMDVYKDWFTQRYRFCQRYLERADSIIDLYLRKGIPCELVADANPMEVEYSDGSVLGNAITETDEDELQVKLWWRNTPEAERWQSLRVVDHLGQVVLQRDRAIEGEPIDTFAFDISTLLDGNYEVRLDVHDRDTGASASGVITAASRQFERDVALHHFAVGA